MKEVKIYTIVSDQLSPPITGESFCTDMVRHSDYAELEAKYAALAADNDKAMESLKQADSAVKLAHEKFSALAAENAGLKHAMAVTLEHVSVTDAVQAGVAAMIINDALHHSKTPVIKVPAVRNKRVRWLEHEEAKRLIDECPEPLKSVVKFALATGLRRSNIINMEWQQIDMQRRVAWVNPEDSKSNRAIGVALNDTACKVLRDQIGKHHKWVFVHTKEGIRPDGSRTPTIRKMRVDDQRAWNAACRRAGIEDFRFHDLRHTWASWLIQSGVPLSVLQEMGGWESIEMVRRYAHLAPNHLTEHAKQIDSIFSDDVPNMSHMKNKEGIKEA